MSIYIYVITDIIHIIKIILICELFLNFKRREIKYKELIYLSIMLVLVGISSGIYLWDDDLFELVLYIVSISAMMCLIYKEKVIKQILCTIWIVSIISMLDAMSLIMIDLLGNMVSYINNDISRLVAGAFSFVFVYAIGRIFKRKYIDGVKSIGIINFLIFTVLAVIETFVVMVIAKITIKEGSGDHKILYSVAFICVILGIFMQLAAVILLFAQKNVYKEKKQVIEKYLNEQKNYYEYLENREKETKKFRHDIRKHMQMIAVLAKERRYEEFDSYIKQIDERIETIGNVVTVHNGIIDAIINQYYSKAIQNNIKMNVRGKFPETGNIDAYDLCTIFSNALSNAFEATMKAEEKIVDIDCRYTDKNIVVIIKNKFCDEGQFKNGTIMTEKIDLDFHGYGLVNIRECIEKYNGVMDIEVSDSEFILKMLLNLSRGKNENSDY